MPRRRKDEPAPAAEAGSTFAVMPTGLNSMIVGHAYGLDLRTCAEAIVYSTTIVLVGVAGYTLIA